MKRLDWTREELILATDLVVKRGWHPIKHHDPEAVALSNLLRANAPEGAPSNYRSVDSVHRKLENVRHAHPHYPNCGTKGGSATKVVVAEFLASPWELSKEANRIRTKLNESARKDVEIPHFVYRLFDKHQNLLYVGMTNNVNQRISSHKWDKKWAGNIHTTSYVEYPSRKAAEEAEREAIQLESPLYNVVHNKL